MNKAKQYRKKPVVIEAIRFTGKNSEELLAWGHKNMTFDPVENKMLIHTLEGTMTAFIGDYIIKGVQGEYYPCKPDIFDATYEAVDRNGEADSHE